MKTIELQIPDGYKLEQTSEGKWEIVKEKPSLFERPSFFEILTNNHYGTLSIKGRDWKVYYNSEEQLARLNALSKLMCVADYLNDGWKPNWNLLTKEDKWCIEYIKNTGECYVECWRNTTYGQVIFKTKELAQKAIEICGEELIKTALGV